MGALDRATGVHRPPWLPLTSAEEVSRMTVQLVNADPKYSTAHLIPPATLGYVHVAAQVHPPSRPGPVLRRGPDKARLETRLKGLGRQLEQLEAVEKVTVFDAIAIPPLERLPYVRERAGSIAVPRFDVVVLVETSSTP